MTERFVKIWGASNYDAPPYIVITDQHNHDRQGAFYDANATRIDGQLWAYYHPEPDLTECHEKYNPHHIGYVGHTQSLRACLQFAIEQGWQRVVVIEDDCHIIGRIPYDWIDQALTHPECHVVNCCPTPTLLTKYGPVGTVMMAFNRQGMEAVRDLLQSPLEHNGDMIIALAAASGKIGVSMCYENTRRLTIAERWAKHDESTPSTIQK